MRKPGTSETRQRILQFIREFTEYRGYAPTIRDILRGCNISSTAVVQHHLNVLEREGYIDRDPKVFRRIQLPARGNFITVPLLEAVETLQITDDITQGKNVFALKVKGLSMIDAYIDDGDIVLMQPVSEANDGDMIAAWLKEQQEVTLKRIYRERDKIRLQPANSQMDPIYVEPDAIEIQGKVVAVIRKL